MTLFTMIMKRPRLLTGSLAPAVLYVLSLSLLAACGAGRSLHFASSLPEIRVDSGNKAVLQCILGGDSTHGGSFNWTGPAVTSGRASISLDSSGTVSTLTITSVGRSDEGTYTCSFIGVGTVSITLNVIFDPHFLNVSEHQEFIEETDAVVECPAFFGDPPGTMIWTRDNVVINDDRFTLEDGRMRIQNIQENDESIYRCSINLLGIVDSRFITVNVLERDSLAPRIVEPLNSIEIIYGEPLDLTCQLEVQRDDVQYTWTVDTDYEDNHFKNTTPALHRDAYQFLGGRYTCKAVNEYGYDEQVFYVRLLAPPKPTACSEQEETRNEGQTIVLEHCPITSPVQLSELHFQWSKDGEPIEIVPDGRFSVNHNGFLTVYEVQQSDSGLYQVNISNSQGNALHEVQLDVTPATAAPAVTLTLRFELSGSEDSDGSCQEIQDTKDWLTSALQRAICDKLAMCSQESDIGLTDSTITCSDPDSKFGTFSATVDGLNAAKIVENIQQFDDFTVTLGNGLSLSLTACGDEMCTTPSPQLGKGQSSGLVAGVVISVIFLVTMVIAAATLMTVIIFKYRKPTNRVTDTEQLERGENTPPSSQTQAQTTTIDLSTVSPNLAAMTTALADITQPPQGSNHTQLPSSAQDTSVNLNAQTASSNPRPVRPNDLCIPGQNGSVATRKKKPLYGRSISLDLPPRQQTLTQSSYA